MTDRGWQWFGVAIVGAVGLCALHAYLVRSSKAAFRRSLVALGCLSAAPLALAVSVNTTPVAGSLSLVALVMMLLSIQASRPRSSCLHHRCHRQGRRGAHGAGARAELRSNRGTKSALTHYDPVPRTSGGRQQKERSHVARFIAAHHPRHRLARRFQRPVRRAWLRLRTPRERFDRAPTRHHPRPGPHQSHLDREAFSWLHCRAIPAPRPPA